MHAPMYIYITQRGRDNRALTNTTLQIRTNYMFWKEFEKSMVSFYKSEEGHTQSKTSIDVEYFLCVSFSVHAILTKVTFV